MTLNSFHSLDLFMLLSAIACFYFFKRETWQLVTSLVSLIIIIMIKGFLYYSNRTKQQMKSQFKEMYELIDKGNLEDFKKYIEMNHIDIKILHQMIYYGTTTPATYAMNSDSFEIFQYILENGYDLNAKVAFPPILFAATYPDEKFIKEILKYPVDLNMKSANVVGNALEIAIWRGRVEIARELLKHGMKFSVADYKKSECGTSLCPWEKVKREIKELLIENYVFNQKKKMFYLNELCLQRKLNMPIFNTKHYFVENMLMA